MQTPGGESLYNALVFMVGKGVFVLSARGLRMVLRTSVSSSFTVSKNYCNTTMESVFI